MLRTLLTNSSRHRRIPGPLPGRIRNEAVIEGHGPDVIRGIGNPSSMNTTVGIEAISCLGTAACSPAPCAPVCETEYPA